MDTLQRKTFGLENEMSYTVLYQTANSIIYNLEKNYHFKE